MEWNTKMSILMVCLASMSANVAGINYNYNPTKHVDIACWKNITVVPLAVPDAVPDAKEKKKKGKRKKKDELPLIATDGNEKQIQYKNNQRCGWQLTANDTGLITVSFLFFSLESSKQCTKYDYTRLYKQGNGQPFWEPLGNPNGYCGSLKPFKLQSIAKSIFIEFITDESKGDIGFNATYTFDYPKGPRIVCMSVLNDKTCHRQIDRAENDITELRCISNAITTAVIKWEKIQNGVAVPLRYGLVQFKSDLGFLTLHHLQQRDSGYYQCTAKNKHGFDKQILHLFVKQKCVCPKFLETSWYNYPPYTQYIVGYRKKRFPIIKGIFHQILEVMLKDVCGEFKKGDCKTNVIWNRVLNLPKHIHHVKDEINTNHFHMAFPILKYKDKEIDNDKDYYFLELVKHPGYLYLTRKSVLVEGEVILSGLSHLLLLLALFTLMVIVAGNIIWILETYWNEEEFPRSFFAGFREGVWWAFVTATTVGYGDIVPRGALGRIFTLIWIAAGLLMMSLLESIFSVAMIIKEFDDTTFLPLLAKVGAINDSEEFHFGVRSTNAIMTAHTSYNEMVDLVEQGVLDGCLVDRYVAGYYKELYKLGKKTTLPVKDKVYGVVFNASTIDNFTFSLFKDHLYNKGRVSHIKDNEFQFPTVTKPRIVDANSNMFKIALISCWGLFILCSAGGLWYEYIYIKPNRRKVMKARDLDMIEDENVLEKAKKTEKTKNKIFSEMYEMSDKMEERFERLNRMHEKQCEEFKDVMVETAGFSEETVV